jgi:hypothetical protein
MTEKEDSNEIRGELQPSLRDSISGQFISARRFPERAKISNEIQGTYSEYEMKSKIIIHHFQCALGDRSSQPAPDWRGA